MLIQKSPLRAAALLIFLLVPASLSFAVDTHVWQQDDPEDFARGTIKNLSVRSDGRVTLAPVFKEIADLGVPYIWSVVENSKGTLYCAGGAPTGSTAKIFAVTPAGKTQPFAELSGLEIHAMAIDGKDRLYAATSPDSKIYRIGADGKSELFFDTKAKYVWALAFDGAGNLYAATGDQGVIYRVTPDGKASEFFHTEETHARSMIIDSKGNLIVGTEPGGFVLRIDPQGKSYVLFQSAKREVSALAESGGHLYVASTGGHPVAPPQPPAPAATPPAPAPAVPSTGRLTIQPAGAQNAPATALSLIANAMAAGGGSGSELYRVDSDGYAEKIWSSANDVVYAIGFGDDGKPLLGTGNKGVVYRIDSNTVTTQLVNAPPTQVTAFARGKNGTLYAATGNVGKLYALGPRLEQTGSIESEVLDASGFATWGRIHLLADLHGGKAEISTRSGNVNRPQKNWSDWESVALSPVGGSVKSPPARFLQYKVTLSGTNESPVLQSVQIAFLPKNIAPLVRVIQVEDANYRAPATPTFLERNTAPSGSPVSRTLPAVGQSTRTPAGTPSETSGALTVQYAKGFITARWNASDENGDSLLYRVEIRGKGEKVWRLLKDRLQERYVSFDGTAFADGEYELRATATDEPSNAPGQALTGTLVSDSFTIDNTPPQLTDNGVTNEGNQTVIRLSAKDALNWIDKAEFSVNGADWVLLEPRNKVSDSQQLDYELRVPSGKPGEQKVVAVRVFDENDNSSVIRFLVPAR